jgi:hypothetical protein
VGVSSALIEAVEAGEAPPDGDADAIAVFLAELER